METEVKVGDTIRRSDGEIGRVVEVAERPSRKTDSGQRVTVERRIRVQWSERRTWLAVSGEGSRWSRVASTGEDRVVVGATIMSKVVAVDRSPMNANRWVLTLSCGHEAWITAKSRPKRQIHPCQSCTGRRDSGGE